MKQLTNSCFFLILKGNGNDRLVLEHEYDNFANLLFTEGSAFTDRMAHRNTLVYTRIELSVLMMVSKKKYIDLCRKSHQSC